MSTIERQNVAMFQSSGYCVLEHAIPAEQLALLEDACARLLAKQKVDMELVKADVLGLSHRDRRYFLSCWYRDHPGVEQLLFGEPMAEIVRALLGDDAYLFLSLFVVKEPRTGMPFAWHQDSGYLLGLPHAPYLSLWCALDDVNADNGALEVLPYDRAGSRDIAPHRKDRATGDFVGYEGDDSGVVVPVARGGIVAMSSTLFHRSGPNVTEAPRRAFLASYSRSPIVDAKGRLWDQAVPFLCGGVRVPAR